MNGVMFDDEVLERLRQRHPRYHEAAFLFVLSSLHHVIDGLDSPRHISGAELADGVRSLAIDRFGPMARTVLEHWGVESTRDLGEIVFALVDCGVLIKQDEDSLDDFEGVFDFEEAFDRNYPWGADLG